MQREPECTEWYDDPKNKRGSQVGRHDLPGLLRPGGGGQRAKGPGSQGAKLGRALGRSLADYSSAVSMHPGKNGKKSNSGSAQVFVCRGCAIFP